VEAIAGGQSDSLYVPIAGAAKLANYLLNTGQPPARRCAPEIQSFDTDTPALAAGGDQKHAVGLEECPHMPQQRHPLLDREIVDIVVEGDDVERLVGCPVADVADF
jgi:hypothetical protein